MKNTPIARQNGIVIHELENEILAYDLDKNNALCLNRTSAVIFGLCDGKRSVPEIAGQAGERLKSAVDENFVWLALDELKRSDLLDNPNELSFPFQGVSRRDVIKKVALASAVALPVISSVIAPSAASAQSSGVTCVTTAGNGSQGNCPAGERCLNSICVTCTPNGQPAIGGCTLADLSGARACCTGTCSLSSGLCTA